MLESELAMNVVVVEEGVLRIRDVEAELSVTGELEVGEALTTVGCVSSILCVKISREWGHEKRRSERVDSIIEIYKNIMVYAGSRYVE